MGRSAGAADPLDRCGRSRPSASEADLEPSGKRVDVVVATARRQDRRVVIVELGIGQQEPDIVDRGPDQRGLIGVLGAAGKAGVDQIEPVVAHVDLPCAHSALANRVRHLDPLEHAVLVAAGVVGQEETGFDRATEEGRIGERAAAIQMEPVALGRRVEPAGDHRRLETVAGLGLGAVDIAGVDKPGVGKMHRRPLAIAARAN